MVVQFVVLICMPNANKMTKMKCIPVHRIPTRCARIMNSPKRRKRTTQLNLSPVKAAFGSVILGRWFWSSQDLILLWLRAGTCKNKLENYFVCPQRKPKNTFPVIFKGTRTGLKCAFKNDRVLPSYGFLWWLFNGATTSMPLSKSGKMIQ